MKLRYVQRGTQSVLQFCDEDHPGLVRDWHDVPYGHDIPPPAPVPQRWKVEVGLCVNPHGEVFSQWLGSPVIYPEPTDFEKVRVTLIFTADGLAWVKPTERDKALAYTLRFLAERKIGFNLDLAEAADRLDPPEGA